MKSERPILIFVLVSMVLHGLLLLCIKPDTPIDDIQKKIIPVSLITRRFEPIVMAEPPIMNEPETPVIEDETPAETEPVLPEKTNLPNIATEIEDNISENTDNKTNMEQKSDLMENTSSNTGTAARSTENNVSSKNPFEDLMKQINAEKKSSYPLIAKRRGYQGRVIVVIELDASGELISCSIEKECKYSILNEAAIELVNKVLEKPYHHNIGKNVILKIPILYRLN